MKGSLKKSMFKMLAIIVITIITSASWAKDIVTIQGCGSRADIQLSLKYKVITDQSYCGKNQVSIPIYKTLNCVGLANFEQLKLNKSQLSCTAGEEAYLCETAYSCVSKSKAKKVTHLIEKIKQDGLHKLNKNTKVSELKKQGFSNREDVAKQQLENRATETNQDLIFELNSENQGYRQMAISFDD